LLDEVDQGEVPEYLTARRVQFDHPGERFSGSEEVQKALGRPQFTEAVRGLGKGRKKGASVVQFY
jgi:hypothetical protein